MEITITLNAPALAESINNLANAVSNKTAMNDPLAMVTQSAAPVQPAPAQSMPTVDPVPVATPAPAVNPVQPVQPAPAPTANVTPTNPVVPTASPASNISYTKEQIANAGAALCEQGRMAELINLLSKYGVQSVYELDKSFYPAIAEDLKAMGANL